MQTCPLIVLTACAAAAPAVAQPVSLTHNESTALSDRLRVGCDIHEAITGDNSWWRAFDLADFGVTGDLVVTSVEFGVEACHAPSAIGSQPVTIDLYQAPAGSAPALGLELRGTSAVDVADSSHPLLIDAPVSGTIDAGSSLVVSVTPPDHFGAGVGGVFFIGVNMSGETDPSYGMSPNCYGFTTPQTFDSMGEPGSLVMIVHGFVDGGCYADCDASGELDFFDFLCFQNLFAAGDPQADCDASTELDFFDFLCFQNEFAAGCP